MKIYKNSSLKKYNTFGLDYKADSLIYLKTEKEIITLLKNKISFKKPLFILGGGSNVLFTRDYKGTIFHPAFKGIKIEKQEPENDSVIVSAGAGIEWDDLVGWSVQKGLSGLENLSLIPGKVGATPVQNIGAYGVEVREKIIRVRTIDMKNGSVKIFSNNECEFGYRDSVFKNSKKGKYLITRVYYRLSTKPLLNLSYGSLKEEVNNLGEETPENTRQGVINIRQRKLPDPEIIGNAGSFFKNPVVKNSVAISLKNVYPEIPVFKDKDGYIKLASGWLIDQCGWKGKRRGDAGVHELQALVLVNYGKASGKEIFELSESIKNSVQQKFGVKLEREVEIVGAI